MKPHEAALFIINRLKWNKCHQLIIDLIEDLLQEPSDGDDYKTPTDVKRTFGALSCKIGNILELINPEFKKDIEILITIKEILDITIYDWEYPLEV